MGQAKLRGTPDQRRAAAIDKQLSLRPKYLVCNHCQAPLSEMQPVDISEMAGIEAAFVATCPQCGHDTYAIKGEREAVARMHMAIEDAAGSESRAGVVPAANRR